VIHKGIGNINRGDIAGCREGGVATYSWRNHYGFAMGVYTGS